eukprot:scaffold1182_cov165-Amphora_coffeaeformis.AAC.1
MKFNHTNELTHKCQFYFDVWRDCADRVHEETEAASTAQVDGGLVPSSLNGPSGKHGSLTTVSH